MQNIQKEKITLINGRIHTPSGLASRITFENGRITSISTANSDFETLEHDEDYFSENENNKPENGTKIIDLKGKTVVPGFCVADADFLNIDLDSEKNISDEEISGIIAKSVKKVPSKGVTEAWINISSGDSENDFLRLTEILFDEAYDSIPFRLRINFKFNTLDALNALLSTGLRTGDGRGFARIGAVSTLSRISPNDKRTIIEASHVSGMQVIIENNKPLLKSLNWASRKYRKNNPRHLIINPLENDNLFEEMKLSGFGGISDVTGSAKNSLRAAFRNSVVINASVNPEENENSELYPFASPLNTLGILVKSGLSMSEALSLYTWNAAWNGKAENRRGEIAIGNDADLVILERDPFLVHPDELEHVKVSMTFCAGCMTYDSSYEKNDLNIDTHESNNESNESSSEKIVPEFIAEVRDNKEI